MSKKKQSIDDVIDKVTEVLAESGKLPENVDTDAIRVCKQINSHLMLLK